MAILCQHLLNKNGMLWLHIAKQIYSTEIYIEIYIDDINLVSLSISYFLSLAIQQTLHFHTFFLFIYAIHIYENYLYLIYGHVFIYIVTRPTTNWQ